MSLGFESDANVDVVSGYLRTALFAVRTKAHGDLGGFFGSGFGDLLRKRVLALH